MPKNNQARSVLFRAQLGDEPIPTPAMIDQARADLAQDAAACATLNTFIDLIVATEPLPDEKWRNRLQAYITAQLAGHTDMTEFADVRQALDRSVALAEEYDLLHTVMAHEAQGTLPASPPPPPVRLDFLPAVTLRPAMTQKRPVRQRRSYGLGLAAGFSALLPTYLWGRLARAATLLILVGALMGGFLLVRQVPTLTQLDSATITDQTHATRPSFFEQQMQIEDKPAPPLTDWQTEQEHKDVYACLAAHQIGQLRRGCPL